MQAHADGLPLALERTDESQRQAAAARSVEDRRDVREDDKRETAPDAHQPYDHRGLVVVASAWLAFYVVATIHDFIASGY
jgi:hypothetical protein